MDKQSVFETIEQFLKGKLKGAELKSFQDKLESDQSFADEVNIHSAVENALKHSPEDELRANLDKLSHQYKPKKNWNRLISLLALAFFLGLGGWWFLKDTNTIVEESNSVSVDTLKETRTSQEQVLQNEKTEYTPKTKPLEKPTTQEEETVIDTEEIKEPSYPPIALNFDVNPLLESHLGNSIRGGDYEFDIMEPTSGTLIKLEKGEAIFRFSGLLKTDKTALNDDFQVHLFSNKKEDYENFRPIFTLPLNFDQQENDFKFDVVHRQSLTPGLYYYLLEDANSGEMIRVGKLKIE